MPDTIDLSPAGIARWVEAAVNHAGSRKQAEVARKVSDLLGYKFPPDVLGKTIKKFDGKPRGLKAEEMIAISIATGYPLPGQYERRELRLDDPFLAELLTSAFEAFDLGPSRAGQLTAGILEIANRGPSADDPDFKTALNRLAFDVFIKSRSDGK